MPHSIKRMIRSGLPTLVAFLLLQFCCIAEVIADLKPKSFRESTTLDAVILSLIQQVWNEPESYSGSGSNIPTEWHGTFRHLVEGDFVALLAYAEDSRMRAKLLDHISLRSASLLESLPLNVQWEMHYMAATDLASFRVIKDGSWDSEYGDVANNCLTVAAVAAKHTRSWSEKFSVAVEDIQSKATPSHAIRLQKLKETEKWPRVLVAIGASPNGPFTLLDGNHRAVLLSAEADDLDTAVQVYVGVASNENEKSWKYWRECSLPL